MSSENDILAPNEGEEEYPMGDDEVRDLLSEDGQTNPAREEDQPNQDEDEDMIQLRVDEEEQRQLLGNDSQEEISEDDQQRFRPRFPGQGSRGRMRTLGGVARKFAVQKDQADKLFKRPSAVKVVRPDKSQSGNESSSDERFSDGSSASFKERYSGLFRPRFSPFSTTNQSPSDTEREKSDLNPRNKIKSESPQTETFVPRVQLSNDSGQYLPIRSIVSTPEDRRQVPKAVNKSKFSMSVKSRCLGISL